MYCHDQFDKVKGQWFNMQLGFVIENTLEKDTAVWLYTPVCDVNNLF